MTAPGRDELRAPPHDSLERTVLAGIADIEHVYLTPRDEIERRLATIWAGVLGCDRVAPEDDFFELGGHSLLAVQLISRIAEEFGEAPPLITLFRAPTLGAFATHVRGGAVPQPAVHDDGPSIVTIKRGTEATPLFLAPDLQGEIPVWFKLLARHLPAELPVYAVRSQGLGGIRPPHDRMEEMVEAYLALVRDVQPTGPYLIAGHCFSGNVAFEMARQLRAAGDEVALLAVIDSPPFGHRPPPWAAIDVRAHIHALTRAGQVDRLAYVRRRAKRARVRLVRMLGRWTGLRRMQELGGYAPYPGPPVAAANMRAARSYTCPPYPGRLTVVTVNPPRTGRRRWAHLAQGGIEQHVLHGKELDHVTVLREPHVRALAEVLASSIRAAT